MSSRAITINNVLPIHVVNILCLTVQIKTDLTIKTPVVNHLSIDVNRNIIGIS